jgi:transcription elongation factor Elf1
MKSSIRETCKNCGESHVTTVTGISVAASYAVVIDRCIHCAEHDRRRETAAEWAAKQGGR